VDDLMAALRCMCCVWWTCLPPWNGNTWLCSWVSHSYQQWKSKMSLHL